MEKSTYILFFYSILVGLTATTYIRAWGELILNRSQAKDWVIPILYSLAFFLAVINEWLVQYNMWETRSNFIDLLSLLIFPFGLYIIGILLHPQNDNKIIDYYKNFTEHDRIVYLLGIVLVSTKLKRIGDITFFSGRTNYEVCFLILLFAIALFINKRIVKLVCGALILLFFIYRVLIMSSLW